MKMRMKKIIWGFFCALLLLLPQVRVQGADLELYATAAVLLDADSGRVLFGKNEETILAMASTTKIMTCILVLENTSPEDILTVSSYAAGMPKVKLYIEKGEQYRVRDLLHSLMLESHNDSAVALAEYVGKRFLPQELRDKDTSEFSAEESKQAMAAFAALMNKKAVELGCENTWFITPNGLDATETFAMEDGTIIQKEHCTTAKELARIMAYCIKESPCAGDFLEITRAPGYSFSANGRSYSCVNHNAFLNMMSGALTGKTGFTNKAGYCYVGALERDGRTFIVALLACGWPNNKGYKWSDTKKLMQYGIDNYFYRSFSQEGVCFDESLLKSIPVQNGQTDILGGTAYANVRVAKTETGTGQGTARSEMTGYSETPGEDTKVSVGEKDKTTSGEGEGREVSVGGSDRITSAEGEGREASVGGSARITSAEGEGREASVGGSDRITSAEGEGREASVGGSAPITSGEREAQKASGRIPVRKQQDSSGVRENLTQKETGGGEEKEGSEKKLPAVSYIRQAEGLLMREDEEVRVEYTMADSLQAPVKSGMQVGNIDYIVDNTVYKREAIVITEDVAAIDMEWCMRQVFGRFLMP